MPPARRPLKALGSLQLVGYANNPTRVITELAFITDAQLNVLGECGQCDVDAPLEVQFEEFMDGVNSRGRGTKTRQRKMKVEQAAAVLLVTVQKGHVELIVKNNDPHTIDVIRVLPEAKRILAAFLPKLRGYGDIPYDQQYRGAIALAKRHFFPNGKPPTKKELMALLLQSYQEKRELDLKCQVRSQLTRTLAIQTSLRTIDGSSYPGRASGESASSVHPAARTSTAEIPTPSSFQSSVELPDSDSAVDVKHTSVASETDPNLDNGDNHDLTSQGDDEPVQLPVRTPVAPRSFNPYMTPVSNPRHVVDHATATPSSHNALPTPALNNHAEIAPDEHSPADEEIGGMLQATAISRGRLNYWYNKFIVACQTITFLEQEKEEIQKEFDITKKKLDETEQRLREANADNGKLKRWGDRLQRQIESVCRTVGLLRGMADPKAIDDEEWTAYDPEARGEF